MDHVAEWREDQEEIMPIFEIQAPDGSTYEIDAPDQNAALAAIGQIAKPAAPDQRDSFMAKADAVVRGLADVATAGFADEIAAGLGTGFGYLGDYDAELARQRGVDRSDADNRGGYRIAGQIAGGVAGGAALAKGGLSLAANAANAGQGLGRIAAGSAADGLILGGVSGFGSGEGLEDRVKGSLVGGLVGAGIGSATPLAVAGAANVLKPVVSPVMARLRPERYANTALGEGLQRGGTSVDKVADALLAARADGQPFTVADAMGHSGQRMLSTVARNPNPARQRVAEALEQRQSGQGRRVASFLSEAFDAPDTAAQRTATMTRLRGDAANVNYGAARNQAGAVNVSPVVSAIDEVLQPGVHSIARPNNQIANDSIEGALLRVRNMLSDGRSNLTDFNAVFRAKLDLDDMIQRAEAQGAGNRAHYLGQVQRRLDESLAQASAPYAQARDVFAADSRAIEAIETGRRAAQRGRPEDTIDAFKRMNADEQYGFRGGYADPLISSAQSTGPGVNKARPLLNDAIQQEIPVVAMPGQGQRLIDRLGRENTMFETRHAALGGSRTADNLADSADMAQFDPSIVSTLLSGRIGPAIMQGVGRAMNEAKGLPPGVLERVAGALMESDPALARQALTAGADSASAKAARRAVLNAILNAQGASAAGRL
jgi:hypothetical protein